MKYTEKLLAIRLRKQGKSYKEIREHVHVSKGTLSVWLRNVSLTAGQKRRLYVTLRQQNSYRLAKKKQETKEQRKRDIYLEAKKETEYFIHNPLFLCGVMLYWAEGDKSQHTEDVKFTNSDPSMITLMMHWFREVCHVPEKKFRIALHIHELHHKKKIEQHWSLVTGIPLSQFHKTQIKSTSLGQRKNILYNGTCAIRICNKDLFRKIQGWKIALIHTIQNTPL